MSKIDKGPNEWHLNIGRINLVYNTNDPYSKGWFYPRYAKGRIHEPVATKLFLEYIKSNSQVLDIGGHLGYFSCIAGKLANKGTVNVFEVDPKCIGLINKNLEINGLTNVTVRNCAVSNQNESVKIRKLTNPNPGLVINSGLRENYIEVKSITVDDFVFRNNIKPDFIKIDVEGAEWNVLSGMKNVLAQDNLTMLVEIHVDKLRQHFNVDYKDCLDILLNNGFTLENINHRSTASSFKIADKNTILKGNTMLLCKKSKSAFTKEIAGN
jgi:FkbM family methyltransferase